MRFAIVMGTRPEVIKLAPVVLEARKRGHQTSVILTGQHRDMALPLLKFFGITPDVVLDVMVPNQTLTGLTQRLLGAFDQEKKQLSADCILVQGDTTSAFAAAYWGFCQRIPVAHVEAGLRTYDLGAPFPEEANRQLIGRIANIHFPPTPFARKALLKEGISPKSLFEVGNTAIDALKLTLDQLKKEKQPRAEYLDPAILEFVGDHPMVLVTAHRRESFGEGFESLCQGIFSTVEASKNLRVVFPVHPNPNVSGPVRRLLGGHSRILLCDPVPYVGFVSLLQRADVILTDSGGVQEEGPTLRKPILVMRTRTERPEGVKAGFAKLVGTDARKIKRETLAALKKGCSGRGKNPYGDGKASSRIIASLERYLRQTARRS